MPQADSEQPNQLNLFDVGGPNMIKLRTVIARMRESNRAPATRLAYEADWRDFAAWCIVAGRDSLPATSDTVLLYLADLLPLRKMNTVGRRVAAIAYAHRQAKLVSPVADEVKDFMAGARRHRGNDVEQKRALSVKELRRVSRLLPKTICGVRDKAMFLLGFSLGVRGSELLGLNVEDLTFSPKGVAVVIRRGKTDPEGKGRTIGVFAGHSRLTDPVGAVRAWLRILKVKEGPLFVGVNNGGRLKKKRLSRQGYVKTFKGALELAGLDSARYGTHSLRAGMITAALESGVRESLVMDRSGHRSMAVMQRYLRPASIFSVNPLAKAL